MEKNITAQATLRGDSIHFQVRKYDNQAYRTFDLQDSTLHEYINSKLYSGNPELIRCSMAGSSTPYLIAHYDADGYLNPVGFSGKVSIPSDLEEWLALEGDDEEPEEEAPIPKKYGSETYKWYGE